MAKILRGSALGVLIIGLGCLICQAAPRKVLSKPTPKVAVAQGLGGVSFDPATGTYRVRILTSQGASEFTYEPRTNIDVIVEAAVAHDAKPDVYSYEYTVESAKTSRQRVRSFHVSYGNGVEDVGLPEGWTRIPSFGRPTVNWFDKNNLRGGIAPGGRAGGFRFRSYGAGKKQDSAEDKASGKDSSQDTLSLPGVVRTTAAGDVGATSIPHLEWIEEESLTLPTADEDVVSGRTVGPVGVPAALTPWERVRRIKEYVDISVEEGWIADDGVAALYKDTLSGIEARLSGTSDKGLDKDISKLVKQAESDLKDGKITSEAYALLKYNVQHLMPR